VDRGQPLGQAVTPGAGERVAPCPASAPPPLWRGLSGGLPSGPSWADSIRNAVPAPLHECLIVARLAAGPPRARGPAGPAGRGRRWADWRDLGANRGERCRLEVQGRDPSAPSRRNCHRTAPRSRGHRRGLRRCLGGGASWRPAAQPGTPTIRAWRPWGSPGVSRPSCPRGGTRGEPSEERRGAGAPGGSRDVSLAPPLGAPGPTRSGRDGDAAACHGLPVRRCEGSSGSSGPRKIPDDGKNLGDFVREAQKANGGRPIFDPKPLPGVKHVIAVASGEHLFTPDRPSRQKTCQSTRESLGNSPA